MSDLLHTLGLDGWKAWLGQLLLPPLPLLLLVLVGAWVLARRHGPGGGHEISRRINRTVRRTHGLAAVWAAVLGLWLLSTPVVGAALVALLTKPPPPLSAAQISALVGTPRTAVLVLGAGRKLLAPDYGVADLKPLTLERLRYGLWLGRQTRLPVGYSGGVGWGSQAGVSEAEVAARVAERDFGQRLRWLEDRSRDTHQNAAYSVQLLHAAGITQIVLVTHDFHQQRAGAEFARAIQRAGVPMRVLPAAMGQAVLGPLQPGHWLPTTEGFALSRLALHEWLGWMAG